MRASISISVFAVVLLAGCGSDWRFREVVHAASRTAEGEMLVYKSCWWGDCGMRIVAAGRGGRTVLYDLRKDHLPGAAHVAWDRGRAIVVACDAGVPILAAFDFRAGTRLAPEPLRALLAASIASYYGVPEAGSVEWLCRNYRRPAE